MAERDGRDEQPADTHRADAEPAEADLPATASGASPSELSPSARTPQEADTQLLDPVEDRPTQVMEGVSESDRDDASDEPAAATSDGNWLGVAAFATGALLLSVVAIVLGHLGLTAAKRGRADNAQFSIAGLILGYAGLALTVVGAWVLIADPLSGADTDVHAQQDVSAVGAAAASLAIHTGALPDVEQVSDGYRVGDETLAPYLAEYASLTLTGSMASDWCLSIAYEGGEQPAFHYVATSGMAPGPCPDVN